MADVKKTRIKSIAVLSIVVILTIAAAYLVFTREQKAVNSIRTTGVIEATEVEISPKTGGTLVWMCCKEGDAVKAGQTAFRLDSRELLARIDEAKAAVASSDESYKEAVILLGSARAAHDSAVYETDSVKSEVVRVRAITRDSQDNLARARGLFKDGYIAKRDLDAAETLYHSNKALLSSAEARRKSADSLVRVSNVNIKAFEARISGAAAKKAEAEANVKVLMTQLSDMEAASPIDGVVVHKAFEQGEVAPAASSVYTVYDLKNIWVRADVQETDAARIKLGAQVQVFAPGMPGNVFKAIVTEAGNVGEFATLKDVTRGRQDIKSFRVKAAIAEGNGFLKPGMTVTVDFYFE